MEDKIFDLNIRTADVLPQYRDPSFVPEEMPSFSYSLGNRDLVIRHKNQVYLSSRVLNTIIPNSAHYTPRAGRVGRVNLFAWTSAMRDHALEQASYSRRSDREQWVADRNFEIIAWIENLVG